MRFIAALNAISSQVWAFLLFITAVGAVLLFHRAGIDVGIAAGAIGAAINMFTTLHKAESTTIPPGVPPTQPVMPAQPQQ